MFEAISRAGCGRTGRLHGGEWMLETPGVLYLDTARFPAPRHSRGTLRISGCGVQAYVAGGEAFCLPEYSDTRFSDSRKNFPATMEQACVIYPETTDEDIESLRGQVDLFALANSIELFQNSKIFIDTVTRIREAAGFQAALYLPGVALPNNIALLAYLGVDLVDTARLSYLSGQGIFMTGDGCRVEPDFCACCACETGDVLGHNLLEMHSENMRVRNRIAQGNLREFVEYRAKTSPKLVEMLRCLDMRHQAYQESRFPLVSRKFAATTRLSLGRPDIVRFRNRVIERYRKPDTPDVLVLLPCSAKKPYSSSKSHGFFRRAIDDSRAGPRVHEVIVTSPLGLVPRELELFYPAQHYDIPVTGHWFEDETAMINGLIKKFIKINKYSNIINHTGSEALLDGVESKTTATENPTSDESLSGLTRALVEFSAGRVDWKNRASEEISSMASFQFGQAAGELFAGCAMAGRFPHVRVLREKVQIATVSQANGMLVPTIEGAKLLARTGINTVDIEDFDINGNLFAVGVRQASQEIRVGDEVVVVRNGNAVASGTARMSGEEMAQSCRGEAVRIRHKAM